ncbi:hypothetical protein PCANC_04433 [Puccinia coronata f. sp. avenae]|uniref:Uncharacterized protein n=1 Tax=Puccinia coronata f. sp. avenae TaxID=200324 RepID=A0A2N5VUR1_9BASI|nr:hypothetical protein PCASD_04991 [Puccinia coronata f. sp. avenae]PLW53734.1 hypothetical protein PCANC_04433 [Puccinia coronata f. sp. avenae]
MVTTPEGLSAIARVPPDEALRDSKTMHMALPAVGSHSHSSEHQGVPEEISNAPIVDNSCPEGSPVAHGQHQLQQNTESHQRGEGASHVPEYSRTPSTSSQDRLGLTLSDWKTTQRIEDEGFQPKTSQITNQAMKSGESEKWHASEHHQQLPEVLPPSDFSYDEVLSGKGNVESIAGTSQIKRGNKEDTIRGNLFAIDEGESTGTPISQIKNEKVAIQVRFLSISVWF